MKQIQYDPNDLIPIVANLARQYTGGDSTSISYEKAQQLMGAVLYCMNEHSLANAPTIQGQNFEEIYQQGCLLASQKVQDAKTLYHQIIQNFQDYGNDCLHTTILDGIPEFFKWYDIKFHPQNTILTLDYPVLTNLHLYTGIDSIYLYLHDIYLEQLFLNKMDMAYILAVLDAYCGDYKNLIENLSNIVFPNIIGHLLLNKPFDNWKFTTEDLSALHAFLSSKSQLELTSLFENTTRTFVNHFYNEDASLYEFLHKSITSFLPRLSNAIKHHHLDKLFLC